MSKEVVLVSTMAYKMDRRREFDRVFLDAVDAVFCQVFGEVTAQMIFLHLERNKGLKREEIPRKVEEFNSDLTELLGSGAHILERLIIRLLCYKLQMEYDAKLALNFTDYVQWLRKRVEG